MTMPRELRIIAECHAETLLINLMGFKGPHHEQGINNVARKMSKDYKNKTAIGIIDNDKIRKDAYYKGFEVIERKRHFIFENKADTTHFLVVNSPDLEKCMFNIAEELNVNPKDYGFNSVKHFKKFTKNRNVHLNQNVKQFLNTLIQKKASPLQDVKTWIVEKLNE